MNRTERRRQKKQEKPKTYVLTEEQIQKIKRDAVNEALKMLLPIPVVVLHDKFGFGKIRLDRFLHYFFGWVNGIQDGSVSLQELMQICQDEAGICMEDDRGESGN